MSGKTTKTARRQHRASEKVRQQARRQAEQRRRLIYAAGAAAVVLIAVVAWYATRPAQPAVAMPEIRTHADQGAAHIALGTPHPPYNSNPPSSGWHTPQVANWGRHSEALPDELIVHNLEHGGIWISYRDPSDTATVRALEEIVGRYRSKVILTPRPQNPAPIAVVAWRNVMLLDRVDEPVIVEFIRRYKDQGPERVPD